MYRKHGHHHIEAYSDFSCARNKGDRKSNSDYYSYVRGNLVTWRSKKQHAIFRSSAQAEYTQTACEMIYMA